MSAPERDFAHQVVGVALLVRLMAIMIAMFALIGQTITVAILLSTLGLSASSLMCLIYPTVLDFVVRHPLVLIVDMLFTLAVIAALGVESTLVLGTF